MDRWDIEEDFWRRNDGDDIDGERDDGTGDFDFNHCSKCVMDGDTSEWAINSFFKMAELLKDRKRWPDHLNVDNQAKNRYVYYILRFFRQIFAKLGIKIYQKWRPQNDMTRDPYAAFGAMYGELLGSNEGKYDKELMETFESVIIPGYLYRRTTWKWRKRLINPHKGKFFILRVRYLRARATVKVFEYFYKIWND